MMLYVIKSDWIYKQINIRSIHSNVYPLNWIMLRGLIGWWTGHPS